MADQMEAVQRTYAVSAKFCCEALELPPKRYQRWLRLRWQTGRWGGGKPGPKQAVQALRPEEREKIIEWGKDECYADLSHRQLAITASESGQVQASASSFYRILKEEALMDPRTRKPKQPQQKPEVKPERPNEVWSWDLTYLPLGPIFVYLFAIIDVHSRKIVGWHLAFNATVDSMKKAWDAALSREGLLDGLSAPQMPMALSDHGVQMAKKSAKEFFRDLGIKQLFARYQTPKDNAWIESWFRILKHDELKYRDYISFDQLKGVLEAFIRFYNTERYHGAIDYVTPEQKHSGQAEEILKARTQRKEQARLKRIEYHQAQTDQNQERKVA